MSSSTRQISGPWDAFDLLPHCRWKPVVHGCPPSVIRPSLLLLPVLGTVCPNMSRPHPMCLFTRSPQSFPLQAFIPMTYPNFCSACAVTVVIFGHLYRSFFLFFHLLHSCACWIVVCLRHTSVSCPLIWWIMCPMLPMPGNPLLVSKFNLAMPICAAGHRHSLFTNKRGRGLRWNSNSKTTPTTTRKICAFFFTGLDRSHLTNLDWCRSI